MHLKSPNTLTLQGRASIPFMLNLQLELAGKAVVINTASIGAVPAGGLRRPVTRLGCRQLDIQDTLNTLFASD